MWYYAECPAVNECSLGLHSCHKHAECIDTTPGYSCRCKSGFDGDGRLSCTSQLVLTIALFIESNIYIK